AVAHSLGGRRGRLRGRSINMFFRRVNDIQSHHHRPETEEDCEHDADTDEKVDGGFTHGPIPLVIFNLAVWSLDSLPAREKEESKRRPRDRVGKGMTFRLGV